MKKLFTKAQCFLSENEQTELKKLYEIDLNKVCLAMGRASLTKYRKFFCAIQSTHDEIISQMRTGKLSVHTGCAYLIAYERNY
jgi:hypothetical protein